MNINTLQQKLPTITLLILILVMISALSFQAYTIFTPSDEALNSKAETAILPVKAKQASRDLNKYKLFGAPSSANKKQAVVKTENLPKTNLRLILRGVSAPAEGNESSGSALIEGPDKETLSYTVNNPLPGKATLKNVHTNRIVIERNGRLENLYFPDSKNIGIVSNTESGASNTPSQSSNKTGLSRSQIPQNISTPASNLDALSDERKKEIKKRLQKLRDKMKP